MRSSSSFLSWFATALTLALLAATGCTFQTPAPQTPPMNSGGEFVRKEIFFEKNAPNDGKEHRKTFMASWASINERGRDAEFGIDHGVPGITHVNIQWSVTKDFLFGYLVNPSFNDSSNDDTLFVEIPITKHYYYEPETDGYNRPTNRMIKNDSRDSFELRPYMDLDFSRMKVHSTYLNIVHIGGLPVNHTQFVNVDHYEWDYDKQFIAFNVLAEDSIDTGHAQANLRFNFMAFEPDRNFKSTPFNPSIAQYINVLHILGKKVNGSDQQDYAGHWKLPVTFRGYNVPEKYQSILDSVIQEWNAAFVEAGVIKPGEVALKYDHTPLQYPFDLRYPVFNWVSDKRISMHAPLGIGEASSDVTNGQFLFGSVTIWAGILEEYMNRYAGSSNESGSSTADAYATLAQNKKNSNFKLRNMFAARDLLNLKPLRASNLGAGGLSVKEYLKTPGAVDQLRKTLLRHDEMRDLQFGSYMSEGAYEKAGAMGYVPNEHTALLANSKLVQYTQDYADNIEQDFFAEAEEQSQPNPFELFDYTYPELSANPDRIANLQGICSMESATPTTGASAGMMCNAPPTTADQAKADLMEMFSQNGIQDADRTFAEFVPQLTTLPPGYIAQNEEQVLRATIKLLVLHELGHVLGLGHNFVGNVLPKQGTIPEEIYQSLKKTWINHNKPVTDPEYSPMEVSTTVMDYGSGISYANLDYDKMKPGPYDVMMLRYLYKQEYPAMKESGVLGRNYTNTTKYFKLPENGVIPEVTIDDEDGGDGSEYKVAFLPSCNDVDASTNVNPFCTRWDRGANAEEIVRARFRDYNARLPGLLNAFSGAKGGGEEYKEGYLWHNTLSEFAQTRVFYDYMRMLIDTDHNNYRDAFLDISTDAQALYAFADSCIDPWKAPPQFRDDFAKLALVDPSRINDPNLKSAADLHNNPDDFTIIHDLCIANRLALTEWKNLLTRKGSDATVHDPMRQYTPAGMTAGDADLNWDFIWGAYKEIGQFPIRLSAVYMVTAPAPIFIWGDMIEVPRYSDQNASYSYLSLYPKEFSDIISTALTENLRFGGGVEQEKPTMGSTLLYMSYFLQRNFRSQDNEARFPPTYIEDLKSLTNFEIRMSPIVLTNVTKTGESDQIVYKYTAQYFEGSKWALVSIPWAYLLTDRRVIARGIDKQMLLPITKLRYIDSKTAYVWAIDLRYTEGGGADALSGSNAKSALYKAYKDQLDNCYLGADGTGLSTFFELGVTDFKGFVVRPEIATNPDLQKDFDASVKIAFKAYYDSTIGGRHPQSKTCEDALKALKLVTGGAAMVNGYWLPQVEWAIHH